MKQGAFTFVLHSHIPYVRKAGRWPHGEEMLLEVMAETYIPLLNALYDLKEEGIEPRLTLGLTPILLEQIGDADVRDHFELYVEERLALVQGDLALYSQKGDARRLALAQWYYDWYSNLLNCFRERYQRDLVGAFRELCAAGNLDILTSAATHGYLPLLERDSSVYGQLKTGIETSRRHLDGTPSGIWLPECAYRPAYQLDRRYKPGIEEFLADLNIGYFFTETTVITGGRMVGKVAGDVVGPYGNVPARKLVLRADDRPVAQKRTTMRPYYVQAANVAVYGREEKTGLQVWSSANGYPGDPIYREFHRKDANSGMQYWRITDAGVDLGQKELYDPAIAFSRVYDHANHFVSTLAQLTREYYAQSQKTGIVVSAFDTELFGHWWFEGVAWIKEVLRQLAIHPEVQVTTARDYLAQEPPTEVLTIPESSWGKGADHSTWSNAENDWMWPLIHNAERTMEELVARNPNAQGEREQLLNQVARELLLLESSDWPFLISTAQANEYASGRFQQHLARFNHLATMARGEDELREADRRFLQNVMDLDNPFREIDYRVFAAREQTDN